MPKHWPYGLGQTLGYPLVIQGTWLIASGDVWWVDSASGDDGNDGRSENAPLATLGQAHTNASSEDIVVLASTHDETLSAALSLTTPITVVGAGKSNGLPTAKLRMNHASAGISLSSSGCSIRNVYFDEQQQANSGAMVTLASQYTSLHDCYMVMGPESSSGTGITITGNGALLSGCTVLSVSTGSENPPSIGVSLNAQYIRILDCVLDGGELGFGDYYALKDIGGGGTAVDGLQIENLSLLRGADALLDAETAGYVHIGSATGGAKVDWDA